ncbi:MAG TPA: PAS domain S-box protein, partial [Spirochaetota bacterium]|nr:PAS domain S-box protein [Spirochaetota bacterium]
MGNNVKKVKKLPKQNETVELSQLLKQIKSLEEHNRRLDIENNRLREDKKIISTDRDYYKKIIENAPAGFLILDSSGKVLFANRILLKMTGTKK